MEHQKAEVHSTFHCMQKPSSYMLRYLELHPRLLVVETVVELGCPPEGPTLIFEDNIYSYYCNG